MLAKAFDATAVEPEHLEAWALSEVLRGAPVAGLYSPNKDAFARFENDRRQPAVGAK